MDLNTVFTKTSKGAMEISGKSRVLSREQSRILSLVDGKSSVGEILDKAGRMPQRKLEAVLSQLASDGFVRILRTGSGHTVLVDEFGFSSTIIVDEANTQAFFEAQAELERRARLEAEREKSDKEAERESVRSELKAEQEARAKQEKADAAARAEAERKEKQAVAREKERLAEEARRKADAERKARLDAELKAKADAERKAREEAERKAAEARARAEAKAKARAQEEAATQARLDAEAKEAARRAAEAKALAEAEARERAAMAARMQEAEAARRKAEEERQVLARQLEEARLAAELEARVKRRLEARAREEEDARLRSEAEARARLEEEARRREEAEARAREEAEARRRAEEEARARAEAERKAREEAEARAEAERRAREEAEQRAREEAETRAREEAEARRRAEEEARARAEAERKAREEAEARAEAERRAREEAEARAREAEARQRAEEEARAEAERKAKEEAQARAEAQAREEKAREERAREEAERRAREEAEARARAEQEERAEVERKAREEAARAEAERKARELAEQRAIAEAAQQAREEERAAAKAEAERRAREEAEEARRRAEEQERFLLEEEERERAEADARAQVLADARTQEQEALERILGRKRPALQIDFGKWAKYGGIGVLSALVLALLLVHVMSFNFYAPRLEAQLAKTLGEPAQIGSLRFSAFPAPHWRLEQVALGRSHDVKIANAELEPAIGDWFDAVKRVPRLRLDGVNLDADTLPRLAAWFGRQAGATFKLQRIDLDQVKLGGLPGLDLPVFGGRVDVSDGSLVKAMLVTADRRATLEIQPMAAGFQVRLSARRWKPPVGVDLEFDTLDIQGLARGQALDVSSLDGELYGGSLKGTGRVDWEDGWKADFDGDMKRINLAAVMPVFTTDIRTEGRLDAKVHVMLRAARLDLLPAAPDVRATFVANEGSIGNVDLVRAINAPARSVVSGGETKFNVFSGYLKLAKGRYNYRQLRLTLGMLSATGAVEIDADRSLSGTAVSELRSKATTIRVPLTITGTLATPSLRGGMAVQTRPAQPAPETDEER